MQATAANGLLEREVEARYGCRGIAVERSVVKAVAGDQPVIVSVTKFELIGYASADFCYAWALPATSGRERVMTALEGAPILSAEDAVWARLNCEEAR